MGEDKDSEIILFRFSKVNNHVGSGNCCNTQFPQHGDDLPAVKRAVVHAVKNHLPVWLGVRISPRVFVSAICLQIVFIFCFYMLCKIF